jgi:uncharacterized protein YvpB
MNHSRAARWTGVAIVVALAGSGIAGSLAAGGPTSETDVDRAPVATATAAPGFHPTGPLAKNRTPPPTRRRPPRKLSPPDPPVTVEPAEPVEPAPVAERWLDAPYLSQLPDLPTGCEATAVAMLLRYAGADVSQYDIADTMPYDWDPDLGFGGDPYSYDGGVIYPPALLNLVNRWLGSAVDLTGADWATIKDYIGAGKPVVVWIAPQPDFSHTVLVTGFDSESVWYHDPLGAPDTVVDLDSFLIQWEGNDRRALSY